MKIIFTFVSILVALAAKAQTVGDPVVMTVNGMPVSRSEFVYSYSKNNGDGVIDKKTIEEYAELYANYKLKVAAALDARLDTLTSFKKEYALYRNKQLMPQIVTDNDILEEARRIYDDEIKRIGPEGLVKPAHILLRLSQQASAEEQQTAKVRIDSIYDALKQGADFSDMARKYSEDHGSARNGGTLPWIAKNQTLKEFEEQAFALQTGQMSTPFLSPVGYHIILMKDRKQLEPFDTLRNDIVQFIEKRNLRESIAMRKVNAMVEGANGSLTQAQVIEQIADSVCAVDSDLKWLFQEYHDGLLLYEISNRTVWEKAAKDKVALEAYFKANKKKYKWTEPRFKGIAYFVRNNEDVKKVKDCVKKLDFANWNEALRSTFNADSLKRIKAEKGIFKQGTNAVVDKMVFKCDTTYNMPKGFAEAAVYGKKLKAPKHYTDVEGLVVSDLQEKLEREWIADLRKRYPVVINKEVLKTIQ